MAFALLLLVVLLIAGRSELGVKGIAICIILFTALIGLLMAFGLPPVLMATAAAIFDIALIFIIFGADIPLRPKN
jgi:hypothetical protein